MEEFWIVTSITTLIFAALVTTGLVITYSFTQWEKTQVGRQFWLTKLCLAAILDYWCVSAVFINPRTMYTPTMPIRCVICLIVGIVMLRWLIILIRAQRQIRRNHENLRS